MAAAAACDANMMEPMGAAHFACATPSAFHALAESSPDMIARYDRAYRYLYVNAAFERARGEPRGAILGHTIRGLAGVPADLADGAEAAVDRVFAGEPLVVIRVSAPAADGGTSWFESRFVPEHVDGAVIAVLLTSRDVTREVDAIAAAQESEAKYAALFAGAPLGLGEVALDGRWLGANPRLLDLLGYSLDELRSCRTHDVTHPEDLPLDARSQQHFADRPAGERLEKRYVHRDGRVWWAAETVRLARSASGCPERFIIVVEDITATRVAQAAAREGEARVRALIDQSPLSTIIHDLDGRPIRANAAFERLWNMTLDALPPGFTIWDDAGLETVGIAHAFRRAYAGEYVSIPPTPYHRTDVRGEPIVRWIQAVVYPVVSLDGAVEQVVCIQEDVSAQYAAEAALRESEIRFESVFESIPLGMAVTVGGASGMMTNANSALARMLGYTREELAALHYSEFTHPDDLHLDQRFLEQVAQGRRDSYAIEKRYVRRDGSWLWVNLSVAAVRDVGGAIGYVVGITEDITERKEIEGELRRRDRELASIANFSPDVIARYGRDLRVRFMSRAFEAVSGMPAATAVGCSLAEIGLPPRVYEPLEAMFARAFAEREGGTHEFVLRTATGERRHYEARVVPEVDDEGQVETLLVSTRDVTQERQLREQLMQAQKMEALGQLAGGVAHDFNNILAAIGGYAELLLADLDAESAPADDVREIARATARGASITRQLLAFSRRQTIETEMLDLRAVVRETGGMLRPLLSASITLALPDADGAPVPVRAARAQIEQIVLNLAVNARDAMAGGGTIAIEVGTRQGTSGPEALLIVADTGSGMSDEVRARVFEPFFTTKPQGQGTGLGLSTVYGLVRQFGGEVTLDSRVGEGTRFTIALPLGTGGAPARLAPPRAHAAVPRGRRMLVAEDEPQLRAVLQRALERAGYDVTVVDDGAAALATIHARDRFDLVVSDVAMPHLGGRELASAINAGWPDVPVVLMSGYAELGATPEALSTLPPNVVAFLNKPFEVDRLLAIAGEALSGASR